MTDKKFRKDLKYNTDNSWIKIEDNIATIGMIPLACEKVKEFVFIQLPEKEKMITKGENYVSLEAIKWSGHLSSPLSGKIIEVNESLFDEPIKINQDPYGSWIIKIQIGDKAEIDELMQYEDAKRYYENEDEDEE
jgi:glycine cleavage system H protein